MFSWNIDIDVHTWNLGDTFLWIHICLDIGIRIHRFLPFFCISFISSCRKQLGFGWCVRVWVCESVSVYMCECVRVQVGKWISVFSVVRFVSDVHLHTAFTVRNVSNVHVDFSANQGERSFPQDFKVVPPLRVDLKEELVNYGLGFVALSSQNTFITGGSRVRV